MKIILTGATGFVGGRILELLILHPDVERITCPIRHELRVSHAKIASMMHRNFCRYDGFPLAGHDARIWALGGKASDFRDPEEYARVTHDFPLALARCRIPTVCYSSGMGADPSEQAWFPWQRATRHLKGRTERDLSALEATCPQFHTYSFRPGGILPNVQRRARRWLAPITVTVSELGRAMILVARAGNADGLLFNHQQLAGQAAPQPGVAEA